MGETAPTVSILEQAEKEQSRFDWLTAASCYRQALEQWANDPLSMGELSQKLAFTLYMAAMQSDTKDEFQSRINQSLEYYGKAKNTYSDEKIPSKAGSVEFCEAMMLYLESMVTDQSSRKRDLLSRSWNYSREAMRIFQENRDDVEYAKTYSELSRSIPFLYSLEWDPRAVAQILKEAWESGERAIRLVPGQTNSELCAKIRVITAAILSLYVDSLPNADDQERYSHKAKEHWLRARELSEDGALLQLADNPLNGFLFGAESTEAIEAFQSALTCARKIRNKLTIGSALDQLAYHTFLTAYPIEDPDRKVALLRDGLSYAQDAREQFSPVDFISPRTGRFWVEAPDSDYYLELAQLETDLEKRQHLLEDTVKAALERLRRAERAGYPLVIRTAHHVLSLALSYLARTESRTNERKKLLEDSLAHRNEYIAINEKISPYFYWNRGIGLNYSSDIKTELATIAEGGENKKTLLLEAIQAKEECLKLCQHELPFIERTGSTSMLLALGQRRLEYGDLLTRLYPLSGEPGQLRSAVESFSEAADFFERAGHKVHMAECYWKAAEGLDQLSNYAEASKDFSRAATCYDQAGENMPQLKTIYVNNSAYMKAWAAVEEAKANHEREQYSLSKEHYEKAADLFRSTDRLAVFAENFSAWSQIEYGEYLSGTGKGEEAISAFQTAASLFKKSKSSIQASLAKMEGLGERELAWKLVKAADLRGAYCKVRICLEEARILAKSADYYSSSGKYGDAAATLEKILQETEAGPTRKELRQMLLLSSAWEKMSRAQGENSPDLYGEASRLFDQARSLSLNEKQSSLALGHSRFCRALQEGTRFMDTRDPKNYRLAIHDLDSAAGLYLGAGFHKESEYAKASRLLLDAYVYMDDASRDKNAEKKTRLYAMAETVLQAAESSFGRAEHEDKKEQVRKLLEKARQEKQLAASLSELLGPSTIFAAQPTFPAPEPMQEKPVGLQRFPYADVQARLTTQKPNLEVGENLDLEIELVNAGRGPAQLIKIEDVIPEGFEIIGTPESVRVEDSFLNMKGKRLNPLKTQRVGLVLRPKIQGTFTLRPRILFLDEGGRYKTHEPDPVEVTIKELAISGLPESDRRLAAIMFTDMVGYSAVAQRSEVLAMELLAEHRKIVRPLYPRHNGREIKTMGDAFLVEFVSALEAVKCAIEIQKSLDDRNTVVPQDKRIQVRVGIHLGDVIHSQNDVYGDAVNVASRIEPLAEPGGVCVSGQVYESVKNALSCKFESLGTRELKNVLAPVNVYKIIIL